METDRAVTATDTARLSGAILLLDRALVAFPDDPYLLHYRGYAAYRQALNCLIAGKLPAMSPFIQRGIADLERSSDKLQWPETYSLLSALNAFRIAVDPSLGSTVGPEVGAISARAAQLGPNNPRVLLMQAEAALNTPTEYGGGADKARELLARALKAFESDKPGPLAPAWGRERALELQKRLAAAGD